jgi:predicted amidohydrolase
VKSLLAAAPPSPNALVVLPEMSFTGFSMEVERIAEPEHGDSERFLSKLAQEFRIFIAGGVVTQGHDGRGRNQLIALSPEGKQLGCYAKMRPFTLGGEAERYTPGEGAIAFECGEWRVAPFICYDLRFPVWSRRSKKQDYDLSIYVANWPERRNHAWKTLLQARAIENQCYVVGVNRVGYDGNNIYHSGDSMVIDPTGEVLYTKAHEEDIFTVTLHKEKLDEVRTKLPFWKDGDNFMIQP